MAITVGNISSATTSSWTHNSNSDFLVVTVAVWNSPITSVTYNGVAMTQAVSATAANARSAIYYLTNPASGSNTVSITTAATYKGGGAISLNGIDTASPLGTTDSSIITSDNTLNFANTSGSILIDCDMMSTTSGTHPLGAGQSDIQAFVSLIGNLKTNSSYKITSTTPETMSRTTDPTNQRGYSGAEFLASQNTYEESITITDTFTATKTSNKELSESISIADTLDSQKVTTKNLLESIFINDRLQRVINRILNESASLRDFLIKPNIFTFTESINIGENLSALKVIVRDFIESIYLNDSLLKKLNGKVVDGWSKLAKKIVSWSKTTKIDTLWKKEQKDLPD